jgi:molybdopterin-guanine dinucleotide biosynthesis protein A
LARLGAQSPPPAHILISANRHADAYAAFGPAVVGDLRTGFHGPLAGIEAALAATESDWLLCIPCDMPSLPADLASRFFANLAANSGLRAVYARSSERIQPVCCLMHRELADSLRAFLDSGRGRVVAWLDMAGAIAVPFDDAAAFANFNTLAALVADE